MTDGHVFCVMPATLERELFTILPPRLYGRADDARWLISTILRKLTAKDVDQWGCVRLNANILRCVMNHGCVAPIIRALKDADVLETYAHRVGEKPTGYRFAKRYLGDECVRVPITDQGLIERITSGREKVKQENQWQPVHHRLNMAQRCLTITDDADQILNELPEHTRLCQNVVVSGIRCRDFPFSVSTTGRVFNAIGCMQRDIRPSLRIDDQRLGHVDFSCSQLSLLANSIVSEFPHCGLKKSAQLRYTPSPCSFVLFPTPFPYSSPPSSFRELLSLSSGGTLYEVLANETGMDRATVKKRVMTDVLAKKGNYPSEMEDVFRRLFPEVLDVIQWINRNDHGELIRFLQRKESWIVVEQISPRLLGRIPMVTLHDAIFSRQSDLPLVESAFRDVCRELDYKMSFKVE